MFAGAWVGVVPVIALAMYLHQKSSSDDLVPDHVAMGHWLSKAGEDTAIEATFDSMLDKYPRQKEMAEVAQKIVIAHYKLANGLGDEREVRAALRSNRRQMNREKDKFNTYLVKTLPRKTLNQARTEVLTQWEKLQVNKNLKTAMTALSVSGLAVGGLVQLFGILGRTIVASLAPVATALSYVFPLFPAVAVGLSTYETYRDWKNSEKKVPRSAKILSAIKTSLSYVSALLLTAGICVPGLQVLILPGVCIGLISALTLGLAKSRIIKHSFEVHQSIQPLEWNYMVARYENYQESFKDGKSSWPKKDRTRIKKWVKLQLTAVKRGLLTEAQVRRLEEIGIGP